MYMRGKKGYDVEVWPRVVGSVPKREKFARCGSLSGEEFRKGLSVRCRICICYYVDRVVLHQGLLCTGWSVYVVVFRCMEICVFYDKKCCMKVVWFNSIQEMFGRYDTSDVVMFV